MKKNGWQRPQAELIQALQTQIRHLRRSAIAYDQGDQEEALRLASSIFMLVHDGGKQQSILTQLNVRAKLRFFSLAKPCPSGNLLSWHPLVMFRLDQTGANYVPNLGDGHDTPHQVQFHSWWEKEQIFTAPDGIKMNRRRLVFAMRNQDGGSHLDGSLTDQDYVALSRKNAAGWISVGPAGEKPIESLHLVSMRHVAWELDQTLTTAQIVAAG